ncbi:hypothetical protein TBLA_0E01990 [Henningerozyma blattae CBS 6284]|uniref:peptidylprolyl isomerase n=1 Tax=Henningerozyma blattae (strain ATCC 34711 / CBS 6284 / DSM 70876 / NBRC 10599 / NRRL Y-10934 / UCD 77-7) TaxID=1071380 RepID=I2H4F0_HENB6|nr:hypothetical protein TBLA_0E01990 [Tetrapisispora blattae CBS 6284]CCH61252.1 hypothetical protein TBLA_0E01990 [Tetrapisispora blattae CBS 6284]
MAIEHTKTYFDITVGGSPVGRIVMELFDDIVPRTSKNFASLCKGDSGIAISKPEIPLSYRGSIFHRVIQGFMCQFGDFTNFDGTGGESIYGEKFEDENFTLKHDRPYLLSMANAGPNTNGSQCFITVAPTPHLDGKHVVFGEVIQGKRIVRLIESQRTDKNNDRPMLDVVIQDCGVLPNDYEVPEDAEATPADEYGDNYEFMMKLDSKVNMSDVNSVIKAAEDVKVIGTEQFKKANYPIALQKYTKCEKLLKEYFPDDLPDEDSARLRQLRNAIALNITLCCLKVKDYTRAIYTASEVLYEESGATDKDKTKAYYRRGLAYKGRNDTDEALKDFQRAMVLNPNDTTVVAAMRETKAKRKQENEKQKNSLSRMFK